MLAARPMCPVPSRPATTSSTFAWSRSTASTRAPVVANASTIALPMPPVAPVTMTPLPSRPAPMLHAMSVPPPRRDVPVPRRMGSGERPVGLGVLEHLLAPIVLDHVLDDLDTQARLV